MKNGWELSGRRQLNDATLCIVNKIKAMISRSLHFDTGLKQKLAEPSPSSLSLFHQSHQGSTNIYSGHERTNFYVEKQPAGES